MAVHPAKKLNVKRMTGNEIKNLDNSVDEEIEDNEYIPEEENLQVSEDEEDGQKKKPSYLKRLTTKLNGMMVHPDQKHVRTFNLVLAFVTYSDFFVTSLMIGNYQFQIGQSPDYLNNVQFYFIIIIVQVAEIIINFFKLKIIDTKVIDNFWSSAYYYIKDNFVTDVISVLPYHIIAPHLLMLRFIKVRRYR